MKRITVGGCFEIPLSDGRYAYGQYLCLHQEFGYLVRIFDVISQTPIALEALNGAAELFPPVFVGGLPRLTRTGRWKIMGKLLIHDFVFPHFREAGGFDHNTKTYEWYEWDGNTEVLVGALTPELERLEQLVIWGAELLERRIETGINQLDSWR